MILPIKRKEIIKCKKCGKIIEDTENAKLDKVGYNPYMPSSIPYLLRELREIRKQEKYNEKYKTENFYYKFGVCKVCIEKRGIIKKAIKAVMKTILDVMVVRR